jgi:GGDEF domain-containing protein
MSERSATDPSSGLFTEDMLLAVLPSRVATARRTLRPLGFVLADVTDGPDDAAMAGIVTASIRDSDIAARLDDGSYAIVLEFTPAEGCLVVVGRLRDHLHQTAPDAHLRAGVTGYPAHALTAEELLTTARAALGDSSDERAKVAPIPE